MRLPLPEEEGPYEGQLLKLLQCDRLLNSYQSGPETGLSRVFWADLLKAEIRITLKKLPDPQLLLVFL